ncbi:MAG: hypothetical protein V7707_03715 [Motiliproteus sp.]
MSRVKVDTQQANLNGLQVGGFWIEFSPYKPDQRTIVLRERHHECKY